MRKGGKNPTAGFTRWPTGCGEWIFFRKPGSRSAATAGPPGWTGRHSGTPGRQAWSGGSGNCRKTRGGHLQTQGGQADHGETEATAERGKNRMPAVSRRGPGVSGIPRGTQPSAPGGAYIGTHPGKASVRGICRRVSERTAAKYGWMTTEDMVGHLNRMLSGWANYRHLEQVSPAHPAIDAHTRRRLRQWLCRKPGPGKGGTRATRMRGCGEPMACRALRRRPGAFRGRGHDPSESRMRENRTSGLTGGDGETWPR